MFDRPVEHDGWIWMRTADAGWWQPAVETGASVAEGDLFGVVSPIIGGTPTRITAPAPGVPLFIHIESACFCAAHGLLLGLALPAKATKQAGKVVTNVT